MVSRIKKQVSSLMSGLRQEGMPSSERIVEEALTRLAARKSLADPKEVRRNFNDLLWEIWCDTLVILEEYEERTYASGIPTALIDLEPGLVREAEKRCGGGLAAGFSFMFRRLYKHLRECFLSIAQSRKARGGKDFELQIAHLLAKMDVPYEMVEQTFRVDFLMPSKTDFDRDRTRSIIASAKRTLRERWREVVEELYKTRCPNIYLLTTDQTITQGQIRAISDHNIHTVVWDQVKKERFPAAQLVLGYSQWANDELPHFMARWSR